MKIEVPIESVEFEAACEVLNRRGIPYSVQKDGKLHAVLFTARRDAAWLMRLIDEIDRRTTLLLVRQEMAGWVQSHPQVMQEVEALEATCSCPECRRQNSKHAAASQRGAVA